MTNEKSTEQLNAMNERLESIELALSALAQQKPKRTCTLDFDTTQWICIILLAPFIASIVGIPLSISYIFNRLEWTIICSLVVGFIGFFYVSVVLFHTPKKYTLVDQNFL
ncbi:hypothetical protein CJU89_4078 [Yarrowia sp. B02]|nr:hypothetical protein CJU89_4078 [Yarrowia sp. B02]